MSSRQRLVALAFLATALVVVYLPALRGGLVWDDDQHVGNPHMLNWAGLLRIWTNPHANQQYYPLTHTTFWLEYQLWGKRPFGYHLSNVALHGLNGYLVYRLLLGLRIPGAWLAAVLFTFHPLQVESVAWITERKNVLSGAFALGSTIAWVDFLGSEPNRQRSVYARSLLLFLLALLAKTAIAPLPVVLALLSLWKRPTRPLPLLRLAPFFVASACAGLFTAWLERTHVGAEGTEFLLSFAERTLAAGRAFWFYPGKLLWPFDLAFVYPRWSLDVHAASQWLYVGATLLVVFAIWMARRRLGFGPLVAILAYGALLFPALGFFNVYFTQFSFVQDHFQYFASVPLLAAIGASMETLSLPPGRFYLRARDAATVLLVLELGVLSRKQATLFETWETLFVDATRKNPDAWMAQYNLGLYYQERGQLADAIARYRQALRVRPKDPRIRTNLGAALAGIGDFDGSIQSLEEAALLQPTNADAQFNLGLALQRAGRDARAASAYERALELHPDWTKVERLLGGLRTSSPDEHVRDANAAVHLLERACERTVRTLPRCLDMLRAAYAAAGRPEDAEAAARTATNRRRTSKTPTSAESSESQTDELQPGVE